MSTAAAQRVRHGTTLALLCACVLAAPIRVHGQGAEAGGAARLTTKTVLFLHSYHAGYSWTDGIDWSLRTGLVDSRHMLDIRVEYMDTKRYADASYLDSLASLYALKYGSVAFDLIISSDDAALDFLVRHRSQLFPLTPVVFCGVNDANLAGRAPRDWFTGIIEVFSDAPFLDLAIRLHPDRKRIIVIGDNSTVGEATLTQLKSIATQRPGLAMQFLDGRDLSLDAILGALRESGGGVVVITSAFTRDGEGKYFPGGEANRLIAAAARGPVYSPSISELGQGIVGGSPDTGRHHGSIAAALGRRLLAGETPALIPITEDRPVRFVFDNRELTRWGINRRDLPPLSEIVNRPDAFYDRYARIIWGGLAFTVLQTAVIAALIFSNVRRRRAEGRLAQQAEALRSVNREMEQVNTSLQGEIAERQRAEAEKEQLTAQLHQSQKMEAVGQLAGGVAHDFNNLLSVILGHAEFALESIHEGHPVRKDLQEISKAGGRAATLTRQLLAFGRKQVLQPTPLDLNEVTTRVGTMLGRIIGEHIDLVHVGAPDLGLTVADRGQLEQVLMNLAVNARDAMPAGGTLRIETANVDLDADTAVRCGAPAPGPYVRLIVSDTGCGMDEPTRNRVFEPFFTTKEQGKGTGLGLSMVYGIVKQSGGATRVISAPGLGARFEILLPRQATPAAAPAPVVLPPVIDHPVGTETILVVEDEEAVRNLAARVLASAGYRVLAAGDGVEALRMCESLPDKIHLVLTDVVMPQMSGTILAEHVCRVRPGIRVIFMSGYADDAIGRDGVLAHGTHLVGKPFSATDLVRKVRDVLDLDGA